MTETNPASPARVNGAAATHRPGPETAPAETPSPAGARPSAAPRPMPTVRRIGFDDLAASLRAGVADFGRAPRFGLFFGGIYAAGGWLIWWLLAVAEAPWLILPIALAFPLVGPFVAVGLYDVSRRLERGETLRWGAVLGVVFEQRRRELGWMAFVVLFICFVWFYQVRTLTVLFLQNMSFSSVEGFLTVVLTTTTGLAYLAVGAAVGGFLALVLFSTTVVAIPLLLERDRDFITAMIVSVRAVTTNPAPMLAWAAAVTATMIVSILAGFLGLLVALPILGHATWHLYGRLVEPETGVRQFEIR